MRIRSVCLTVLAILACTGAIDAADEPKRSPELQVLDRIIGDWETVITDKLTGNKSASTESRKWSAKGEFVLSKEFNQTIKKEAHFLITYDPAAKTYRGTYISETGAALYLGTWDEATNTLKWTGADIVGNKFAGATRFIDKDHVEWSMMITNSDGKLLATGGNGLCS